MSTYPCTPTGDATTRDCVRVSQLNTTGVSATVHPTKVQDFLVAENGEDSFMGGVGLAGNGTLHVVWSRSSATTNDFPSSYAAYQLPTDGANTLSAKKQLQAGTAAYIGERWGDYVGVAQDPLVPSAVWQANESSGGEWKTWVSQLQPLGTTYVPITPVRVLDTRVNNGLSGMFTVNVARTWQVTGVGGIPANAVAVTGNVTVTQQQSAGYLAVTPTATNKPSSSTINFPLGDNRANNLAIPLSSTGSLSAVYLGAGAGKKTHLIFDVTGYFLADDTGATFTSITPARILDTRINAGLSGKFVNGTARKLLVTGGAIPSTATAITGNLTVTQQSAGGYLSVSPTLPAAVPATSNLNFPVSDNRANGLYAPLDGTGHLWIVYKASGPASSTTHVILDVTGYFVPGTTGLRFVPLNPGRTMDTRSIGVLSGLSGCVQCQLVPDPARRRPLGCAPRDDGDHRQPDGDPTDRWRLRLGLAGGPAPGPCHLDAQFPARRQPCERHRRPAQRIGGYVPRVRRRVGKDDTADPRPVGLFRIAGRPGCRATTWQRATRTRSPGRHLVCGGRPRAGRRTSSADVQSVPRHVIGGQVSHEAVDGALGHRQLGRRGDPRTSRGPRGDGDCRRVGWPSLGSRLPKPVRQPLGRSQRRLLGSGTGPAACPAHRGSRSVVISCSGRPIEPGPPSRSARRTTRSCRSAIGFRTKTVDYIDRAGLVEKYRDFKQYSPEDIEEVDYVIPAGGSMSDVIHERFDLVLASHVLEHSLSLIDFLNECTNLLAPEGSCRSSSRTTATASTGFARRSSIGRVIDVSDPPPSTRRHHDRVLAERREASRFDVWSAGRTGELSVRARPRRRSRRTRPEREATTTSTSTIGSSRPTTSVSCSRTSRRSG